GELELCAAVAAIIHDERQAMQGDATSPWQTFGWMPVGRRQRNFAVRGGHGTEQKITLNYGSGPSTLVIGERELAFAIAPKDGGFDLT
ncbi:hypothetical protein, partial [Enterococcus faecium]